ncbi:RICIN domain-containing protein [Tunturibacter empetritectus]|uniref:RICIN domain-containing protein n=1 Tax=Tunturiibacter empetritectus TaxID=3069691 RepID=A0AAU7ZAG1_9BACT
MLRITALARHTTALLGVVSLMLSLQPGTSIAQSVLTQHNDLSRSGANPNETILTTSNVNESSFGRLFSLSIDGFTYAQPLYDRGVSISGGTHNVLYVATAHDSVYAFDADSGAEYWHVSLGTPVPSSVINTQNILVEVGIISTPVIDSSTGTLYVVAKTYESKVQIFRLHALDIDTGAEKFGGPVEIAASVSGSGQQSSGGQVPFVASQENQRAAVTLVNGIVYLAFASHEDYSPYHGWLLGYKASNLQQVQVYNVTPNSGEGAIWMGGQGLLADSSNNLYLISANSTQTSENAAGDYGESFLKLVPSGTTLSVADYFKPNDYDRLNANDTDLGSTGAFAIPGTSYIAGGSKSGMLYVVDTNNMGKLNTSSDQVVQEFQADNGLWGSPAFFNNTMYIWGVNEPLKAYQFSGGHFNTSPSSQSAYSTPGGTTSGSVSVSSNGTTAGTAIVWATAPTADPDHSTVGGNMYAYDATNLGTLLWSTAQNSSRDSYGSYAKFVAPTIADGKVYVGTDSEQVAVYGLLPGGGCTATVITPYLQVNGAAWQQVASATVASGSTVNLGPQPLTGGSWSWTGPNGFNSTSRQINSIPLSSGTNTYIAAYTNPCGSKSTQTFAVTVTGGSGSLIPNGTFVITSVHSGQAIDDPGFSTKSGQDMQQYTVNNGTNQQWNVTNLGNNVITITNVASGQLLEVTGASKANSALVDQMPANGKSNQEWNVISVGAGAFELTNVNSGQALDVDGGGTTVGEAIDQYPYQGTSWQKWIFTRH